MNQIMTPHINCGIPTSHSRLAGNRCAKTLGSQCSVHLASCWWRQVVDSVGNYLRRKCCVGETYGIQLFCRHQSSAGHCKHPLRVRQIFVCLGCVLSFVGALRTVISQTECGGWSWIVNSQALAHMKTSSFQASPNIASYFWFTLGTAWLIWCTWWGLTQMWWSWEVQRLAFASMSGLQCAVVVLCRGHLAYPKEEGCNAPLELWSFSEPECRL